MTGHLLAGSGPFRLGDPSALGPGDAGAPSAKPLAAEATPTRDL